MVTFCTASSGQVDRFPSLTLLVLFITSSKKHSVLYPCKCIPLLFLEALAACPTSLSLSALSPCISVAGFTFTKTGVQIGHSCSHTEGTSSLTPLAPTFCRCLIVAGLPRTVLAAPAAQQGCLPLLSCGVDKRLALFPVRRRAQTQTAMA